MLRRFLAVPLLLTLFVAVPARASVPDPASSTWPHHVLLVGTDANGVVDPAGRMDFTICRTGCLIHSGFALIVLDFSNSPGIEICSQQPDPNVIVDCSTHTVRYIADGSGHANFAIAGRVDRSVPGSHAASCGLYADGVPFGTIPVAAIDQDGGGVGPPDNSLWQQDYFSGQYWERSDFNGDGVLGPADLSLWTTLFFASGSLLSCRGSTCP